jgi:O-antigen/teichoic acid export membrane protein
MGEQYAGPSGKVMQILLLSVVFSSANTPSAGIVYGMEKHKRIALWGMIESVLNLSLSIILVRRIGIYGVAWGTTIPSVLMEMILWPSYICKLLEMPVRTYLWQTWFRTGLGVIPFALACAASERYWPAHNLAVFFAEIAVLLPLLPLTLAVIFRHEVAIKLREWRERRLVTLSHEYETSTTTIG